MNQIIGLKEFNKNSDLYAQRVKKGQSFIVVKQSKPMFRISSPVFSVPDVPEMSLEEADGPGWKTVIDFTKIKKGGVPAEEVLQALKNINESNRKKSKKIKA